MNRTRPSPAAPPARQDRSRGPSIREFEHTRSSGPESSASLPSRYLAPEEVAALFGVPLETVYQWRRKRTGPPGFRVGRHLRYDPAAITEWVAGQTRVED